MKYLSMIVGILGVVAYLTAPAGAQEKRFRYAYQSDILSMDPYARAENFSLSVLNNIYEPLSQYNEKLEIEPALAESWSMINPTTWRFKLRHGIKFHDGAAFNADDVVFSFNRATAKGADMGPYVGTIEKAVKVDEFTVDLITKEINTLLPSTIAFWYIMDREWAEANGAENPVDLAENIENFATTNANGTGPFRLASREPGVRTAFSANTNWWGAKTKRFNVSSVVFTPIASDATRTAALLSGELDTMFPVPVQDTAQIESSGVATVLQSPALRTIFFGMDLKRDKLLNSPIDGPNPFLDKRVRQAIYHAIDAEAIRSRVMRGASTPTALIMAPGVGGFNPELNKRLPYDPDKSKKLLADAGYGNGFELQMECPNDRFVNDEQICQVVTNMLAKIGIKVNLLAQTKSKFFGRLTKHEVDFFMMGWIPDDLDAGSVIAHLLLPPEEGGLAYNGGRYGNPRISELSKKINVESDPAKRQAMMDEVFRVMQSDVAYIPLHQQALSWGVRKGVSVAQRADNALLYKYINIK